MTALYLVRHGQASFGADDYDRLSELGHRQSRWLGDYFAERGIRPDRVVIGSLRRHRETWEGIAEGLGARGIASPAPTVRAALDEYQSDRLLAAHEASASADGAVGAGADAAVGSHPDANAPPSPDDAGGTAGSAARTAANVVMRMAVAGDPADPAARRAHFRILREALTAWAGGHLVADGHPPFREFRSGAFDTFLATWSQSVGSDDNVIVVTSGGPISSILVQLLGMPDAAFVTLNLQTRNTGYTEFQGNGRRPHLVGFNGITHLDTAERRHFITYS